MGAQASHRLKNFSALFLAFSSGAMARLQHLKFGAPINVFCVSANAFVTGIVDDPVLPEHVTITFEHQGKTCRKHFSKSSKVEVTNNAFVLTTQNLDTAQAPEPE